MDNPRTLFIKRLKQARQLRDLSQRKLGILAGLDEFVASTRINRYEQGVHEPELAMAQRLCHVLNVPLAYLYTEDDELADALLHLHTLSKADQKQVIATFKQSVLNNVKGQSSS